QPSTYEPPRPVQPMGSSSDIMTPDTSRGQQAVIGITNYILAKIPG
ncbi:hypothetical protein, partial [Mycobacterium canetti]